MLRNICIAVAIVVGTAQPLLAASGVNPEADRKAFQKYFTDRFPKVPLKDFVNGPYSMDAGLHKQWLAKEEFPPYEFAVEKGKQMFNTPFKNGKTYSDCFASATPAQRNNYPHWDKQRGMVITLPLAINDCRTKNGEQPLKYSKGPIASLLAYMAFQSRGQKVHVVIPKDDPRALQAYEKGKQFYFTRRGQLNFSCAQCHMESAGLHIRTDILSPALGHTTGWPVYRSKWGEMGTLHRRFEGCNKQVRAKPFPAQSEEYRDLEYFMSYMSNGLEYNGPSSRK